MIRPLGVPVEAGDADDPLVTCPTCSGDCGVTIPNGGGDYGEDWFVECPTCEGAGEVTQDQADDVPLHMRDQR